MSKDVGGLSPFEENETPPLFDGQVISYRNADYLPDRKALDQAAMQFFAEINSVIYILDQDRFHLWIDDVYGGRGVRASVLVILYLVMALCGEEDPSFHIARPYIDDLIEESSLESVRAIMLMSLYRQRENERSVAWAMLSVAIRISMSLGLHQNIGYVHDTSIYGSEVKRRLWWSLCEFDNWSSCMLGHSSGLGYMGDAVSLPSQEFNTTPYTPPGYATSSASLGSLIGQISQQLYIQNGNLRSKEQLTSELIQKVEAWNNDLPDHLRPNSAFPSCFARATLYLNLKYNYARMLIGRPYMAHSIFCNNGHDEVFKSRAETCKLANRDSIRILTEFYCRGLLSTALWLDTYFILATAIVLFLRVVETPSVQNELKSFLPVLKMCDRNQIAKYAAGSLERLLHSLENGITENPTINVADPFSQSSRLGDGGGSCHEIDFNNLGDLNTLGSECFGLGDDFDLDLCGPWNTLESGLS
ncbi:Transcription factor, fungi [Penicillium expansum]|nr:Transcription factor, fungi [Penicillium expansum]